MGGGPAGLSVAPARPPPDASNRPLRGREVLDRAARALEEITDGRAENQDAGDHEDRDATEDQRVLGHRLALAIAQPRPRVLEIDDECRHGVLPPWGVGNRPLERDALRSPRSGRLTDGARG